MAPLVIVVYLEIGKTERTVCMEFCFNLEKNAMRTLDIT